MGLVNRVVPPGSARTAAEKLAHELAMLPQACLRSDRQSVLEGLRMSQHDAMANEFRHGAARLAEPAVTEGVARFRGGAGRSGTPA